MSNQYLLSPWLLVFLSLGYLVESGIDTSTGFLRHPPLSPTNTNYNNNGNNNTGNTTGTDEKGREDLSAQCEVSGNNVCPYFVIVPGHQGPPGPEGPRGLPGPIGSSGNPGNNGQNGYPGVCQSVMGPKGNDGHPGEIGPKGNKGEQGLRGPLGDIGPPGVMGQNGTAGICIPGKLGPRGETGRPGLLGETGEKGDVGESGRDTMCEIEQCRSVRGRDTNGRQRVGDNGNRVIGKRARFSAFSVSRYGEEEAEYADEIITWDYEFMNAGGDFDLDTGIYNCSISGYYFFTFTIYKSSVTNYPLVQLMLNEDVQVSIIDADFWDSEDSSSNSVILELNLGDLVWLQLSRGRILHSGYYRFTTFSGTLLHIL